MEKSPSIFCLRLYRNLHSCTLTKEFLHSNSHLALSKNSVNSVKSVKTPINDSKPQFARHREPLLPLCLFTRVAWRSHILDQEDRLEIATRLTAFAMTYGHDVTYICHCEERSNLNCLHSSTWEVQTHFVNSDRDSIALNSLVGQKFRLLHKRGSQ